MAAPAIASVSPHADRAVAAHALRQQRVGRGLLAFYGAGAIVDSSATVFLGTFLYFYLTAVCGLAGGFAGLALGVALAVDAFVDPLVGSLSDNSHSAFGRRHPFMLASIVPIAACLGLLFSVPAGLKGLGLAAYVLALSLGLRIGLSVFNVPYIALGSELSDDYHERSTIVAFRVGIGAVGTVISLVLGYGVFLSAKAGGQLHRAGYPPFAWSGAVLMAAAAAITALGTLSARARLHAAPLRAGGGFRLFVEMREVFANRSFDFLAGACLIFFVGFGAAGALTLHANTFFWRLPPAILLFVSLSGIPGLLTGLVLTGVLSRRLEKRSIALCGLTAIAICQASPVLLRLAGVLPPSGPLPIAVLVGAAAIASAGVAMALVGFQSMMADAADEHDLLFGARREGLYFAGISFAAKASTGLGVVLAGLATDLIHFPTGLTSRAAQAAIPWPTVRALGLIYGPGAAVITVVGILVLLGYRLDRQGHARIVQALAERNAR